MVRSIALTLLGFIALLGTSHAAVLITIDDEGRTQMDVFDNQVYYHLEDGRLEIIVDLKHNLCSLISHDNQVHIEGKCDEAHKDMEAAVSEMMKQQGIDRDQMMAMRKMMAKNRPQAIEIKPAGSETIAEYVSDCFDLSKTRSMCVSKKVMTLIGREFDYKKMITLMRQFDGGMMGREPSAADKAEIELRKKGYVMKDVDLMSGMPNAGMLQMMPEAARKQIMAQFQQSGAQPMGTRVIKVEENGKFKPQMPDYPKKSMREFAKYMMSQ